jgi:hypothetical protein
VRDGGLGAPRLTVLAALGFHETAHVFSTGSRLFARRTRRCHGSRWTCIRAQRDVALLLLLTGTSADNVTPWSVVVRRIWVTAEVSSHRNGSVGIHAVLREGVRVRALRTPGLASLAACAHR